MEKLPACEDYVLAAIRKLRRGKVHGMKKGSYAGLGVPLLYPVVTALYTPANFHEALVELIKAETVILIGYSFDGPGRKVITDITDAHLDRKVWTRDKNNKWVDYRSEHTDQTWRDLRLYIAADPLPKSIRALVEREGKKGLAQEILKSL